MKILDLVLLFVLMGVIVSPASYAGKYTSMPDEGDTGFYALFSQKTAHDTELDKEHFKTHCDLSQYTFSPVAKDPTELQELQTEFITRRLAKKKQSLYSSMTDQDVTFLLGNERFMDAFQNYLGLWVKAVIFTDWENEIVNESRVPNPEYPLGRPTLDSTIRSQNQSLVQKIGKQADAVYATLNKYMQEIATTHNYALPFSAPPSVQ